jgi:hypothetical protein
MNKKYLLTLLTSLFFSATLFGQQGITVSGMLHQPNWDMTQYGFWGSGGVKIQFLGKEALRGLPVRLQTGLSASYLNGQTRRFGDPNQFGGLEQGVSFSNHATRLGGTARLLSWPGMIRVFAEVEAGAQYVFSTSDHVVGSGGFLSSNSRSSEFIGGSLGYYYGYGGGIQYRILPFLYAQLGVQFVQGSGARVIDLNSIDYTNNTVEYTYERSPTTGFTEYNLGVYFRFGNHDNNNRRRNNKRRSRDSRESQRRPSYWDRG